MRKLFAVSIPILLSACSTDHKQYVYGKLWLHESGYSTGIGDIICVRPDPRTDSMSGNIVYRQGKAIAIVTGKSEILNQLYIKSPYNDSCGIYYDANEELRGSKGL